jgi:hypothetical protein
VAGSQGQEVSFPGLAHDQNGISVAKILLGGGGAAAPERGAQTGHGWAVSYTGLIAEAYHAQPGGKKLFDEVIFLVIDLGCTWPFNLTT